MADSSEIRTGRHVVFSLHAHLVFTTKYRRRVFNNELLEILERVFRKVCADFEAELTDFNGEEDHVHLLVVYPPKVSLAKLVNSLKGVSSYNLRRHHLDLIKRNLFGRALWSPSYFAGSCGGAPISVLKSYIENQKRPKF